MTFYKINLIGALTSKPFNFKARPWELKSIETIDLFDSFNSNIKVEIRGSEIMRILPCLNEEINQEWITDKARHAFDGLILWRLTTPSIRNYTSNLLIPRSWTTTLGFIRKILTYNIKNKKKIFFNTGMFTDMETITILKDITTQLGIFKNQKKFIDFPNNYLTLNLLSQSQNPKIILIVGSNLRFENPLFNLRLRQLSFSQNVLIGYIGTSYTSTIKMIHLGNNISILYKILFGNHFFCKKIMKLLKKDSYNFYYNKIEINLLFGLEFLRRIDSDFILKSLLQISHKKYKINLNVLYPYSGYLNALDLGWTNIDLKKSWNDDEIKDSIFYLIGVDNLNNFKKNFIIFQGHNSDLIDDMVDILLPTTHFFEKSTHFLNNIGIVQKTTQVLNPPKSVQDDWKILKTLSLLLELDIPYNSLFSLKKRINQLSPQSHHLYKYNFIELENFQNIKYQIYNSNFVTQITNYYESELISRDSVVMRECAKNINYKNKNFNK